MFAPVKAIRPGARRRQGAKNAKQQRLERKGGKKPNPRTKPKTADMPKK
jgi:hypothetical protein